MPRNTRSVVVDTLNCSYLRLKPVSVSAVKFTTGRSPVPWGGVWPWGCRGAGAAPPEGGVKAPFSESSSALRVPGRSSGAPAMGEFTDAFRAPPSSRSGKQREGRQVRGSCRLSEPRDPASATHRLFPLSGAMDSRRRQIAARTTRAAGQSGDGRQDRNSDLRPGDYGSESHSGGRNAKKAPVRAPPR